MDLFKFNPPSTNDATILQMGEEINNYESIMWVERYADPGEFSLEAKLSTGLREFLPLGTLISHVDTLDVMIVENHEIKETSEADPVVAITGRSLESFLENRIAGMNAAKGANGEMIPYTLPIDYTWNQIVKLINDHIVYTDSVNDSLTNVKAEASVSGTGEQLERPIQFSTVWERVSELLKIDDLGIKTLRRNTFGGDGSSAQTTFLIYRGADKSASVMFAWKAGDLSSADYLFSQKSDKNAAFIVGQYVNSFVETGFVQYNRRTMIVDGRDIDGHLGSAPIGQELTRIIGLLNVRGHQVLSNQNHITISQADISRTTNYRYRRDYNIGDLVTLDGNFSQMAVMRVVEYAEIEDENGESGHPTLALPMTPGQTFQSFT